MSPFRVGLLNRRLGLLNRRNRGFTLIEIIIAIMIGAILTSMAVKGVGATSTRFAASQARNVFSGMVAETRAQAIESGQATILIANRVGDSVIILGQGGVDEKVRFAEVQGAVDYSSCAVTRAILDNSSLTRVRPLEDRSWVDPSSVISG